MRFTEFAPPPPPNQEGTLATLLQFLLAKAKGPGSDTSSVKVPTDAVLKMMNNTGAAFSYEDLEALVNSSDKIKNVIKGPITRKTIEIGHTAEVQEPDDQPMDQAPGLDDPMQNPTGAPPPMQDAGDNQVAQMANRATNKAG